MPKRVLMVATVPSMIGQFNMSNIHILLNMGYQVDVAADFSDTSVWPIEQVEKFTEDKKEFCDDYFDNLNIKINSLKIGEKVLIKHYYELEYVETISVIKRIDKVYKKIYLVNSIIEFDDIIEIKKV